MGVKIGLRAVVEARVVDRVSGRVGEVRVAADEAGAVDLGGADSEILSGLKKLAHCQRSLPVGTTRRGENQAVNSSRADSVSVPSSPNLSG
jgi:hypothetical protein